MSKTPGKARAAGSKGGRKSRAKDGASTREKIFLASVDLFAKRGYDGVTTREIARAVGIKDSSIYKHYASKEAILDDIFEYFKAILDMGTAELEETFGRNTYASIEDFFKDFEMAYPLLWENPTMVKIIRIISIESYHNEKIKRFFLEEMIVKPMALWERVFGRMVERKLIKPYDPQVLANEFYALPLYLLLRYFILEYDDSNSQEGSLHKVWPPELDHHKFFRDAVKIDR